MPTNEEYEAQLKNDIEALEMQLAAARDTVKSHPSEIKKKRRILTAMNGGPLRQRRTKKHEAA